MHGAAAFSAWAGRLRSWPALVLTVCSIALSALGCTGGPTRPGLPKCQPPASAVSSSPSSNRSPRPPEPVAAAPGAVLSAPSPEPLSSVRASESAEVDHVQSATCEAKCVRCSTIHDSRTWTPAQGRALTAQEHELISGAFKQYLSGPMCASDPDRIPPALVGTTEDSSRVMSVIDGSFTEKGRRQAMVLFFAGHCGVLGTHAEDWGKRLVIIIENNARIATFVDEVSSSQLAKFDLNHDKIDEVLAWGGFTNTGSGNSWVEPRSYAGARQRTFAHFVASENACGGDGTTLTHTESRIQGRWDATWTGPCFLEHRFMVRCPP